MNARSKKYRFFRVENAFRAITFGVVIALGGIATSLTSRADEKPYEGLTVAQVKAQIRYRAQRIKDLYAERELLRGEENRIKAEGKANPSLYKRVEENLAELNFNLARSRYLKSHLMRFADDFNRKNGIPKHAPDIMQNPGVLSAREKTLPLDRLDPSLTVQVTKLRVGN